MELFAYSLVNMYFMGIQAGIQSAHSQSEMIMKAVKSQMPEDHLLQLLEWQKSPTMILKRAGDIENMRFLKNVCEGQEAFPFATFEETGAGNGVISSITIIMPDVKETCARDLDGSRPRLDQYSPIEQELFMRVNRMRSAT